MNPADGSYPWLNSVNVLGVVSAIAKALKRGNAQTAASQYTLIRRISVSFAQKTSGSEEQILPATISLEVTPPRPLMRNQ